MDFALTASLEAYRRADTVAWATYAKRMSGDIGEWAAEKLESTQASDVLTQSRRTAPKYQTGYWTSCLLRNS
jgi:hypothetical protein